MEVMGGAMLMTGLAICAIVCLLFFFFQAEDGIRDYKVTGVQTCALPILRPEKPGRTKRLRRGSRMGGLEAVIARGASGRKSDVNKRRPSLELVMSVTVRSEERRVGEECRSRWSPYHLKKKKKKIRMRGKS